ncbi:MAG: magnesium transporter [Candidatus Izimaplasma sp.]|nr:magnesium transporter [Candidatus Izimaplasma bacterium]
MDILNKALLEDIKSILIENINDNELAFKIDEFHAYEIAKVLLDLDPLLRKKLYKSLSMFKLTEVFEELSPKDAFLLLEEMNITTIINIFQNIETDDLVDIIEIIEDKDKQLTFLALIDPKKRKTIKAYLNFNDNLVGSIMNTNYVKINRDMTIATAIKKVVADAPNVEYIHNIYVVNDSNNLVGTISLKELINKGNEKASLVEDVMVSNLVYLYPTTDLEESIELMKNYDFQLLPVVSHDKQLIGIVSFDDIVEVLNEESQSDYANLAGLTDVRIEENETVFSSLKKRLPWLIILLFVNLITSSIITSYERELQTLTTLAVFMPLILNMAGNSSTQGLGVIIRMFATSQLKTKTSIIKHLFKEFLTGLINGVLVGIGLFILVMLFNLIRGDSFEQGLNMAFVISLSISIALIVATLAGSLVPLFINAIKIDPATASGPFITTINDIFSLLIYFGLATTFIASLS